MATSSDSLSSSSSTTATPNLSRFERIFTTSPPILELLLLHLPTGSIFDLYHTSPHLRSFFRAYPLAFKNLSFRLLLAPPTQASASGTESPDILEPKRPCALDLLLRFGLPSTACLARLDLDNTSVSGTELHATILNPGRATLQHLSVRGCKDVSIKYHILPYLHMHMSTPPELLGNKPLALKSLYTYRCRHHRRRPYLPQSLNRKDSDSQPTHQLIELCHRLGIWTDTAWCPSPGSRCHRRKEYFIGRGTLGADEVWVPFDRLWRSHNVVGSVKDPEDVQHALDQGIGRLWEDDEYGYGGEALGSPIHPSTQGKEIPTHLRASHRVFVDGYKCHACGDAVLERCEQCSIRMHCMGCRKTLCHSCAFDRPVNKKRRRHQAAQEHPAGARLSEALESAAAAAHGRAYRRRQDGHKRRDPFWWAPGAARSPNLMREEIEDDLSSGEDDQGGTAQAQATAAVQAPRLDMHWCCLKPSFSGGGGLQFVGTPCGDNVRASPLPQGRGFEDPDFSSFDGLVAQSSHPSSDAVSHTSDTSLSTEDTDHTDLSFSTASISGPAAGVADFDILPYLESAVDPNQLSLQRYSSPRSLCTSCYTSSAWKIPCAACSFPICIEHDLKRLKARRCGFRRLARERENIQQAQSFLSRGQSVPRQIADAGVMTFLAKWRPIVFRMAQRDRERRVEGKWTPSDDRTRSVDRFPDLQDGSVFPAVARAELVLPDLSALLQHGGTEDEVGSPRPRRPRRPIWMSRTQSTSSVPYAKPLFPPLHQSATSPSKMSVSFLLNPAPAGEGSQASRADSADSDADSLPRSLASSQSSPLWIGCGAYLCASPRMPGDPRPLCGARDNALYCHACGVLVCPACIDQDPPCPCRACSAMFHCPNCRDDPRVQGLCCRLEEEEELLQSEAAKAELAQAEADSDAHGAVEVDGEEFQGLVLDGVADFWALLEAGGDAEPAEAPGPAEMA